MSTERLQPFYPKETASTPVQFQQGYTPAYPGTNEPQFDQGYAQQSYCQETPKWVTFRIRLRRTSYPELLVVHGNIGDDAHKIQV